MDTDQRHTKNKKRSPKIPCAQILVERNMAESARESDPNAVNLNTLMSGIQACIINTAEILKISIRKSIVSKKSVMQLV